MNKKNKISVELSELSENQAALQKHKEKQQKARQDMKNFWNEQLNSTAEQRQREKDAADVLRK